MRVSKCFKLKSIAYMRSTRAQTAECAVFTKDGFVRPRGWSDDVNGWMSPKDVLALMNQVAKWKPKA